MGHSYHRYRPQHRGHNAGSSPYIESKHEKLPAFTIESHADGLMRRRDYTVDIFGRQSTRPKRKILCQRQHSGTERPVIVLVHGAWAEASSWNSVIPLLQTGGYTVYAPPNPLRGLASDAATIVTFLKSIPGPVILVGHSYGGCGDQCRVAGCPECEGISLR